MSVKINQLSTDCRLRSQLSLHDVLNEALIKMSIEMLIVMSIEDQSRVYIDAQQGMPLVHDSFIVQSPLKAYLPLQKQSIHSRKLQKNIETRCLKFGQISSIQQSFEDNLQQCKGEVKANLENQPKEQHNAGNYHQHCTLHPETSHHYNQQYLHMISCILRYLYEN